jgi:hypothetical protein
VCLGSAGGAVAFQVPTCDVHGHWVCGPAWLPCIGAISTNPITETQWLPTMHEIMHHAHT